MLATTAVKASTVGQYPITLTGGASDNYELTRTGSTLEVTKAALALTADPQSKVYGDAKPGPDVHGRRAWSTVTPRRRR